MTVLLRNCHKSMTIVTNKTARQENRALDDCCCSVFEDGIEKPFHSLDAVYTYYPDFNTTIKLRVQNIFNDEKEIEQEGLTLRKLSVGTGINASITYNF